MSAPHTTLQGNPSAPQREGFLLKETEECIWILVALKQSIISVLDACG